MVLDYWIFNDIHFPYEDKQRYAIALQIMQKFHELKGNKPAGIYLNGDIGEFAPFSSWPKDPDLFTGQAEIAYINKKFDELSELFPATPVTLIEGNHCYRFFRYIRDNAPALAGLINIPQLLRLKDRGWGWVPYGPDQLCQCGASNLYLRHEPIGGGVNSAKGTAESVYVDTAFGHSHTWQYHSHRKFGPSPYVVRAYSLGWLGDKTRSVFDYRGSRERWVEGFTHVECDSETGHYTLDFIDLRWMPVLYRGEIYSARR